MILILAKHLLTYSVPQGRKVEPMPSSSYLYVPAVVTPGWKLDASESDWTLERNLDGRLLYTILAI